MRMKMRFRIEWAYKILVAFVLIFSVISCKDTPTSPIDRSNPLLELTQTLETTNFSFHYSPGDFVYAERSEAFHDWAVTLLGITCPKKVDYYKYKDREQQKRLTGSTATGWAMTSAFEAHSYFPWMNHECAHLYTSVIGRPPTFFNEGIAVAFQTDPYNNDYEAREKSGERIHDLIKRYKDSGVLYSIEDIIENSGFNAADYTITYPQSGSFVRYLIDTYGIEPMKTVFSSVNREATTAEIKAAFQSIYGITIEDAEQDWLNFIG